MTPRQTRGNSMAAAPISLYLDLKPGEIADLEVVARASLAFAGAIRELAYVLDPSLEIKVQLASGTEGSLNLNSIVKSLKPADGKELTLAAIGGIVLLWFGNHLLDWTFDEVMDHVSGKSSKVSVELHLDENQLKQLQGIVDTAIDRKIGLPQVQQVYRELESDPAIVGVGATRTPARRPATIVPRSEFSTRSGVPSSVPETTITQRERVTQETLIVIRPVLLTGHRRWRFAGRQGEFGAPVLDDTFLQNLVDGHVPVLMKAGIEMDVDLQTIEQKAGDIWVPIGYNVLKVRAVRATPTQTALKLPSPEESDDDN